MGKILIIIPAYNEEKSIEKVVDNLINNYPQYDYVIINDGSLDDTDKICQDKGYHYINLPINLGIGGAVQTGYQYALEKNYDIAVQADGDGQHNIEYIEDLIEPILTGDADVVIGSRFLEKEGFQSSFFRRMGIRFLSFLIWITCGKQIKDVTSGFRAVNKKFIEIFAKNYPLDYPEPETIVATLIHRGCIREIPVVMNERQMGNSSINFTKSIYYMIKVTLAVLICRISFGIRR